MNKNTELRQPTNKPLHTVVSMLIEDLSEMREELQERRYQIEQLRAEEEVICKCK